ncbi:hypothetical protein ACOME3_000275 [Neoechinorhynchus agilis]
MSALVLRATFSTSSVCRHLIRRSTVNIVDNSKLATEGMLYKRRPCVIHVYNRQSIGRTGDVVLLAVRGRTCKAVIVGCKGYFSKQNRPRFDTNNVVLVDKDLNPLGTRIFGPVSTILRNDARFAKIVSLATCLV